MERNKIDYGIDLGTTNSAICRMEKGYLLFKNRYTSRHYAFLRSCKQKGALRIGQTAYNAMQQDKRRASKSWKKEASNTYIEFKRAMGTDRTYESSFLGKNLSAEELSAEVLKALKSFVLDESVKNAVITVPAKFTLLQKRQHWKQPSWLVLNIVNYCRNQSLPLWHMVYLQKRRMVIGWYSTLEVVLLTQHF